MSPRLPTEGMSPRLPTWGMSSVFLTSVCHYAAADTLTFPHVCVAGGCCPVMFISVGLKFAFNNTGKHWSILTRIIRRKYNPLQLKKIQLNRQYKLDALGNQLKTESDNQRRQADSLIDIIFPLLFWQLTKRKTIPFKCFVCQDRVLMLLEYPSSPNWVLEPRSRLPSLW